MFLYQRNKNKYLFLSIAFLAIIALFVNNYFWQDLLIGLSWTVALFLILSILLADVFGYFFKTSQGFKFIVGFFLTFYLIAIGLAIPIVFFKITLIYFYLFLLFLTLIIYWLSQKLSTNIQVNTKEQKSSTNVQININTQINNHDNLKIKNLVFCCAWLVLYVMGWILIIKARTGEYVLSPWDVLSKYYQVVWFGLSLLLIFLIFSKINIKKVLFLIILTSLLFHAYLPFVSQNSFGVDRWRHVGAERRLMSGEIEPPALIGEIDYIKIGPISLPRVFTMANKFSYSNQWGMTIGLSWLTQVDALKIDQYLIWFLWSIFFTVFVYKLSHLIFNKKKLSLLTTFVVCFCFFSLQVGGAITVPHAIGFLPFLFFLFVFFSYLRDKDKKLWFLIIFILAVLVFNYILYLVLALKILIFGLILKSRGRWKKIILPVLTALFAFSLPLFDRFSGTSFFVYSPSQSIRLLPQKIVDFLLYLPNYLFYRGGESFYLPLAVKDFPWLIFFAPLVFLFVVLGIFFSLKSIQNDSSKFQKNLIKISVTFLFIFLVNQFVSLSFMKDYRLLVLRMSNLLILFLALFFTVGIYWLIEKLKFKKIVILFLAVFLSLFSLIAYASGPAYANVTNNELAVAKYLDQEIKHLEIGLPNICVFDAGWRLLALESVNGMIAGNFPTDAIDFVQKEKDELYRQMLKEPSREILDKTLKITGAQKCFFVVNQEWLKSENFNKTKELLGQPVIKNNTYIWNYEK